MKRQLFLLLVIAVFIVTACSADAVPAGAIIPPDSSEISGAAGAAPSGGKPNPPSDGSCSATDADAASFASEVIALVNQQRAANGLGALTSQSQLTAAAQRHSLDMGCNFFLSHTGSDGSSPYSRIVDSGYPVNWWGENVAAGYSTAQAVMDAWMNSQVHRDNILNPNYTEIGIGYVYNANDTTLNYKHYWTMTLGSQ